MSAILYYSNYCNHCKNLQPKISLSVSDNHIYMVHKNKNNIIKTQLSEDEIKKKFENIPNSEIELLLIDPMKMHPKNLILSNLPVLPSCSRPYIIADNITCDDDLTIQYVDIIKINNNLKKHDLPENKRTKYLQSLKFRIRCLFDNSHEKAKHTNGRPMKGMKKRLAGKEGQIRNNLMGKRVNKSARTVIGPDSTLKLNEIALPKQMAKILTYKCLVNKYNINYLQEIVNNNRANFIIKKKGNIRINLKYAMFQKSTPLLYGDIILRQIKISLQELYNKKKTMNSEETVLDFLNKFCNENIVNNKIYQDIKQIEDDINMLEIEFIEEKKKELEEKKKELEEKKKELEFINKFEIYDVVLRNNEKYKYKEEFKLKITDTIIKTNIIKISPYNKLKLLEGDRLIRNNKEVNDIAYFKNKYFKINIGDYVERQLIDGDIVLLNRQPTLHKGSMLAKRIKILPGKTIRMNLATTKSFNADFDGDEMNIHVPSNLESECELRNLANTKKNLISAQSSKNIITIVQDSLLGAYLMTTIKSMSLGNSLIEKKSHFFQICSYATDIKLDIIHQKIKTIRKVMKKFGKKIQAFTGKGLFSLLLPNDFIYESENNACNTEPTVKIYNGVLYEGSINKKNLGSAHNSIQRLLLKEYGEDTAFNFINNIQFITRGWLLYHGFSVSISDCIATKTEQINQVINRCFIEASGVENTTKDPRIKEIKVNAALSKARDNGMKLAKDALSENNNFVSTVTSGSKGDYFNIAQITGLLGQQNFSGKRIKPCLNNNTRTLPHYPMKITDKHMEYESNGFIKNSFIHGLNPREFWFHAITGREGVTDTAMKTAQSGYIQRRMVKLGEDLQIKYDGTVRNSFGSIIQFQYGNDNLDSTKIVLKNNKPTICDVSRLTDQLNLQFELKKNFK